MNRILGFDFARSLAVLGMIIVNYKIVMSSGIESHPKLIWFTSIFEGRAAALFVVLAGIGISLMFKKYKDPSSSEYKAGRINLLKKAVFLFIVGLCYTPIWPADILHFYGVYIAFITLFISFNNRKIIILGIVSILVFILIMLFVDYESSWNFNTFQYLDFWTFKGMVRHIFYNGFHPLFPWAAFMFFGIYLGRLDWHSNTIKKKLLKNGLIVFITVEFSRLLLSSIVNFEDPYFSELSQLFFSAKPMPPFPIYIISASASALIIIILSIYITEKFSSNFIIKSITSTGKLALTVYVAHVVFGMGILEEVGLLNNQPLLFSLLYSIGFYSVSVVFSIYWLKYFKIGPLEYLMRKVTS